jgi:hypothetical protein
MAAYGLQPEKSRYRAVTPQTATTAPLPPPGTPMEPPNPTAGLPPVPAGTGGFRPTHPGNGSKPIDQVPEAPTRPIDQTRFRGGREGLPPQMPVGPTNQRPGTAPRPVAPRPAAPIAPPPPAPPAPIIEPPNPTGGVGLFPGEGTTDPTFDTDLRSQLYTPGDDQRLTGAMDATDAAGKAIQDGDPYSKLAAGGESRYRKLLGTGAVAGGPDVNATDGGRYLEEQDAALKGLAGPSRTELAKQALADFDKQGEKGLAQRFRTVGQNAAKFGRIGAGMTTNELGDIQSNYERDRLTKQNELARDVSEGDIADRFRRVDATSGLRRGESGIESGIRGEQRTERGYNTDLAIGNEDRAFDRSRSAIDYSGRDATQDINDRYDRANQAGSLEDRIFGQGQSNRGEFRAERGRQDSLARQSIDDRVRQRELETSDRRERLSRAIALMQAGGQVPNLDQLLA